MDATQIIKNLIDKKSFAVFYIFAERDTPAFAYTVGLTHYGLNELLLTGNLHQEVAASILNALGSMLRDRKLITPAIHGFDNGESVSLGGAFPMVARDANAIARQNVMIKAKQYYHGVFRAQQILWPDTSGRLPTDPQSDFTVHAKRNGGQPLYI